MEKYSSFHDSLTGKNPFSQSFVKRSFSKWLFLILKLIIYSPLIFIAWIYPPAVRHLVNIIGSNKLRSLRNNKNKSLKIATNRVTRFDREILSSLAIPENSILIRPEEVRSNGKMVTRLKYDTEVDFGVHLKWERGYEEGDLSDLVEFQKSQKIDPSKDQSKNTQKFRKRRLFWLIKLFISQPVLKLAVFKISRASDLARIAGVVQSGMGYKEKKAYLEMRQVISQVMINKKK